MVEFFIDLLFYHTRLKCYVVVELKAQEFKPEHAGQLNFYLSALDAQVKAPDDKPTIGLLLCRSQNRLVAEYALSGIDKPIGVAEYQLVRLDTTGKEEGTFAAPEQVLYRTQPNSPGKLDENAIYRIA